MCVFFLQQHLAVQSERVLRVAHHYFRRPHVGNVVFQRVVAPYVVFECDVSLLVVTFPYEILEQVPVAYVHQVEVYCRRRCLLVQYALCFCRVAFLQRQPYAYGVAVVYGRGVAYLVEVRVGPVEQACGFGGLSEVQQYVGHVKFAYIHLIAVLHAVFGKQLFLSAEHGFGFFVVFGIIVVVAVVCQEVQLHVHRHEREALVRPLVAVQCRVKVL